VWDGQQERGVAHEEGDEGEVGVQELRQDCYPTVSADALIALLATVTQRVSLLPPEPRLLFVERIQLRLLDIFLTDDIMEALEEAFLALEGALAGNEDPPAEAWATACGALNSLHFIIRVLSDWDDEPCFIELHAFRNEAMQDSFNTSITLL
jgi:AcrR family transcriptional regulator